VDPANINPDVVAAVGSDPLTYPEATNNFKNMIHGIHKASDRPYEFVRNRVNGFYYNWSEVTFPGDLRFCEKCHLEDTYRPENLPAGVLWETERTTTGDPAETRADWGVLLLPRRWDYKIPHPAARRSTQHNA
jgi:hypothetical protein